MVCIVADAKESLLVIKAVENYDEYGNKRALKVISEAYLDNDNSEFH